MNLLIKPTQCHEMLWQGEQNQKLIISHILHQCINEGKSRQWFWCDFTMAWYRDAQNAYNQMASNGYVVDPFTMVNALTNAFIHYPNFEMPCRDLQNEYSDVYYITKNDFAEGLEKCAILHPNEYAILINFVFNPSDGPGPGWEITQNEYFPNAFDFAFQYIVMGRQKYRKVLPK
jgi:hypothetical protein